MVFCYESLSDCLVDFMMYSGVLQSNICFANGRKNPFFIRKWVGNQRKNDWKTIKISWNRVQIRWKIAQGTWRPSGAPWGAQGVPDWILGVKNWFVGPPLDPLKGSIFRVVLNAKLICFFVWFWDAFWSDVASILDAKIHPKWGQKWKTCVFDFECLVWARA